MVATYILILSLLTINPTIEHIEYSGEAACEDARQAWLKDVASNVASAVCTKQFKRK